MKQIMGCPINQIQCLSYTPFLNTQENIIIKYKIGFGLPYGTEYTNPEKAEYHSSGGYAVTPQADPNGLFKAQGVQATWICMIDPVTGDRRHSYGAKHGNKQLSYTQEMLKCNAKHMMQYCRVLIKMRS